MEEKSEGVHSSEMPLNDLCFDYPEIEELLAAQGFGATAGPEIDELDAMDVSEDVAVDLSMTDAGTTTEICTTTIVILDGGKLEVPGTTVTLPPEENPVRWIQTSFPWSITST
ncbi:unnamed protein product [Orchesella dallaii]|uniref:Uncharacterized protein n=1 Tax=Orchesella dallaii TaxID=48710 RepID=A0ABP1RH49_9HEXA